MIEILAQFPIGVIFALVMIFGVPIAIVKIQELLYGGAADE